MKYFFIFLLSTIIFFSVNAKSFAQTKTTTPTSAITQQQIDELKSKIASKVAELKLVVKKGVLGTVTDSSDTQITLTDQNGNIKNIDVDELTKFYSSDKSFGISDIKKGQTLGVLGLFNKDSRRILAREVNDISALQKIEFGFISNIDKANYEITIAKENGVKYIFEIQDITKTFIYQDNTLAKSGFSKIQPRVGAIATGFYDKQNQGKILALKVIILPNINLSDKIKLSTDPTIVPSTGSGIKLYPITK